MPLLLLPLNSTSGGTATVGYGGGTYGTETYGDTVGRTAHDDLTVTEISVRHTAAGPTFQTTVTALR